MANKNVQLNSSSGDSLFPFTLLSNILVAAGDGIPGQILVRTESGFAWMWASELPKERKVVLNLPLTEAASSAESGQSITTTGTPTFSFDSTINKGCIHLNGSSFLTIAPTNLPMAAAPRSLSVWAKSDAAVSANKCIFSYGSTGSNKTFGLSLLPNNAVAVVGGGGTDYQNATAESAVIQTNWNHFCVTYDGETEKLYVNGILAATKRIIRDTNPAYARLGTWISGASDNNFSGSIADLKLFDNIISEGVISSLSTL